MVGSHIAKIYRVTDIHYRSHGNCSADKMANCNFSDKLAAECEVVSVRTGEATVRSRYLRLRLRWQTRTGNVGDLC